MPAPGVPRWASTSLDLSLWRGSAVGGALWMSALAAVVVADSATAWLSVVLAAGLVVVLGIVGAVRPHTPVLPEVFVASVLAALAVDVYALAGELSSAAVSMSFVLVASPTIVLKRRRAVVVVVAGTAVCALAVHLSGSGGQVMTPLVVIAACYTIGVGLIVLSFRSAADAADRQIALAEREEERTAAARTAASAWADYSRMMHDTVINTLTAVARGVASGTDQTDVQRQCAADLAAVAEFTAARDPEVEPHDDSPGASGLEASPDRLARRIRYAGAWAWSAAVGVSNVVLAVVGGGGVPSVTAAFIVAVAAGAAWMACRDGRTLPTGLAVIVAGSVPVAFTLGFLGVDAGGDPELWPGIGLTPLLIVLLIAAGTPVALYAAGAGLVAACILCATVLASTPTIAGIAVVNLVLHVAQMVAWTIFAVTMTTMGSTAAAAQRRAVASRLERESVTEGRAAREHWQAAGGDAALDLLRDIRDGSASVDDSDVRRRADTSAHFLRQILLLDPALVYLGPWLGRALGHARRLDVRVELRVGTSDVASAAQAADLGSALLTIVDGSAPETELTVSRFGGATGTDLTVVGPTDFAAGLSDTPPPGVTIERRTSPGLDIVALTAKT